MFISNILLYLLNIQYYNYLHLMKANEFFTLNSLTTLSSCTLIVYVISNAIQHVFNFNPKYLAFLISLLVSFLGTYISNGYSFANIFLGFANGCLLYCTIVGLVQLTSSVVKEKNVDKTHKYSSKDEHLKIIMRKFWSNWY